MLHKTSFMKGFHLLATDGEIGHIDDFLVDEDWNLRFAGFRWHNPLAEPINSKFAIPFLS